MSEAKRDNHAFHRTAVLNHAGQTRTRNVPPQNFRLDALDTFDVASPWGSAAKEGRDPYNAVGNRAATGIGKR